MRRRTLVCIISAAAYALLLALCAPIARLHMLALRRIYAALGRVSALFPRTIAEPLALMLGMFIALIALRAVYSALRRRSAAPVMRFASGLACFALISASAFALMWPSYLPQEAPVQSAYSRAYDVSQLEALISALAERARADEAILSGLQASPNRQGSSSLSSESLPQRAAAAYARAVMGSPAAPKPARLPDWMARLRAAGVFIPFTGEAIYDPREPDFMLPFTMLHELAHASGVVHEDEANLLALRVGLSSGDAELSRSSALAALRYALMTLRELDGARFERACAQASAWTLRDLNALGIPARGKNAWADALAHGNSLPASSDARGMFARRSGAGEYDGVVYLLLHQYGAALPAACE